MKKGSMQSFKRFGFRRNTHTKNGKFKSDSNVWQAHVWNRSDARFVGLRMPSSRALSFSEVVKACDEYSSRNPSGPSYDEEEIALALMKMAECGLVEIEQVADYSTDLYNDGVKFWNDDGDF
jgi:hypothetical protein